MSVFTSLLIVFLAMLIQAFMQLVPGIFAIFYHSALSRTSAKKADDISLSFIVGNELFLSIFFVVFYSAALLLSLADDSVKAISSWILVGIFVIETLAVLFLYYRKGKGSMLFIKRKYANNLSGHAASIKNRSDAITLGLLSGVPELLFTLPLFIIVSNEAVKMERGLNCLLIIAYIILTTVPLFITRTCFRSGLNLADIMRLRTKNKQFFRFILVIAYLLITILLITRNV